MSMIIRGSEATIKVDNELNIRYLLCPHDNPITLFKGDTTTFYILPSAYCILEKYDENDGETYYVVSYQLNESGKSTDYDGSVDIIFELSKEDKVNYFSIGFGTPHWMNRLDFNGYEEVKWQYNFLESTAS